MRGENDLFNILDDCKVGRRGGAAGVHVRQQHTAKRRREEALSVCVHLPGTPAHPSVRLLEPSLPPGQVGEAVKVDVLRRGREKKTVTVVLGERQPEPAE